MNSIGIIGGGPIGLFSALVLAKKGHAVTLIEKRTFPIDKVCGQGIMPKGHELLKSVEIDFANHNSAPIEGITYFDNGLELAGLLEAPGIAVERKTLSQLLYQKCLEQKTINILQARVENVISHNQWNEVILDSGQSLEFKYLLACDGLHSHVRKCLKQEKIVLKRKRMGARFHFHDSSSKNRVEVYWDHHCEAYVTPTNEHLSEVAFLWEEPVQVPKQQPLDFFIKKFPQLQSAAEKSLNDFKIYGPFNKVSKSLRYKNVFFVGDAYQFLDGITGEGISLGLRSAERICQRLSSFSLWDELVIKSWYLKYHIFVALALCLSRFPKWRKVLFKLLMPRKRLFSFILQLNDL